MSDWNVRATLTADDSQFSRAMKGAQQSVNGLSKSNGSMFKGFAIGGAAFAVASKVMSGALNLIRDSVGGAIQRFDTLKKYPVVMDALGY